MANKGSKKKPPAKKTPSAKKTIASKKTPATKKSTKSARSMKNARNAPDGKQPRKQLVSKSGSTSRSWSNKDAGDLDVRVAEARKWWNALPASAKLAIMESNDFGKERNCYFPVDSCLPTCPPPPKRLTRDETPGTRGPAHASPIVCGWCDLTLANQYDAFDHYLMEVQTHALQCCLPVGNLFGDGFEIGRNEGEYKVCGKYFATRSAQRKHVNRCHFAGYEAVADIPEVLSDDGSVFGVTFSNASEDEPPRVKIPLTLTLLETLVPCLHGKLITPVPTDPKVPYYRIFQNSVVSTQNSSCPDEF